MTQEPQPNKDTHKDPNRNPSSSSRQHTLSDISINKELLDKLDNLGEIEIEHGGKIVVHVPSLEGTRLPIRETQPYLNHVLDLIYHYNKQARWRMVVHNALQLAIFIGAAAATIFVSFSKIIPAILTGLVTVATAIANYYKFGERARAWEWMAEDLALEYNRFQEKRGTYKDKPIEETLTLFMDRVESLTVEKKQRVAALEQLKRRQIRN